MKSIRWDIVGFVVLIVAVLGASEAIRYAGPPEAPPATKTELQELQEKLDSLTEKVKRLREFADTAEQMAVEFDISPALSALILKTAKDVGVPTRIAYKLVWMESRFYPNARGAAGEYGLTQVMPGTARYLEPGITKDEAMDPATNLRLGFTYLRDMLTIFEGDVRLSLLAYNRGPHTVRRVLAAGGDPANGYARMILE